MEQSIGNAVRTPQALMKAESRIMNIVKPKHCIKKVNGSCNTAASQQRCNSATSKFQGVGASMMRKKCSIKKTLQRPL
jgi:hypothetical protein